MNICGTTSIAFIAVLLIAFSDSIASQYNLCKCTGSYYNQLQTVSWPLSYGAAAATFNSHCRWSADSTTVLSVGGCTSRADSLSQPDSSLCCLFHLACLYVSSHLRIHAWRLALDSYPAAHQSQNSCAGLVLPSWHHSGLSARTLLHASLHALLHALMVSA